MDGKMFCDVCGVVDEYYDENSLVDHNDTPKHISNKILHMYKEKKKYFGKNRDGLLIFGTGKCNTLEGVLRFSVPKTDHLKIRIMAQPCEQVRFMFTITNDMRTEDLLIVGVMLGHPQPQFIMDQHPFIFGKAPNVLTKKTTVKNKILVRFESADIGQFEMPIIFTVHRESDSKNIIIVREMVVLVSEEHVIHPHPKTPFTDQKWEQPDHIIRSVHLLKRAIRDLLNKRTLDMVTSMFEDLNLEINLSKKLFI